MYLDIDQIKVVQLDHTSRCNLSCPQCARFHGSINKLNPYMPISDCTLDDYKIILEPFKDIELFHCGNFGDSIASPTFNETFTYSLTKVKKIKVSTNGSLRSKEWWRDLAKEGQDNLTVIFSIDGLEDTNHLYRVNSSWSKIIEKATEFINAGGNARWYFIEFEHNYHQINEARDLANDIGFKNFTVKYTSRFADQQVKKVESKAGNIIVDIKNNKNQEVRSSIEDFTKYVLTTPITCKYQEQKAVFIDVEMNLWPCTWLGAPPYFNKDNAQRKSFQHLYDLYGTDFNNLRKYGWQVLEHDFFKEYLENSWYNQSNKFARLFTCGRTCGDKFEFSSGYGNNIKRENL